MSLSITVMTFNLHDEQPEDSPNSWEKRKDLCISIITSYSPTILCTQQGLKGQLDYLQQGLPGYGCFGISRKGAEDSSDEHCAIFFEKEKVELVEGGTFWLSEAPSVPGSMSWGAVAPCIATWAISFILRWLLFNLFKGISNFAPMLGCCFFDGYLHIPAQGS
uniref:Endonuclease/exonuclease/phosphatase domain-containing protein n=1 Tax=Opuntia streptacantha TaxID=393608 RepID=A0A7C9ECK7_OPUST